MPVRTWRGMSKALPGFSFFVVFFLWFDPESGLDRGITFSFFFCFFRLRYNRQGMGTGEWRRK